MSETPTQDRIADATGSLLIRLAFLVPKGTDVQVEIGPYLIEYRDAIVARERAAHAQVVQRLTEERDALKEELADIHKRQRQTSTRPRPEGST